MYFALFCAVILLISALVLHFVLMPNISHYKANIANIASEKTGLKISIGDISANWDGLNPHFILTNMDIFDAQQRSALSFKHIEANLSWLSIPLLKPKLALLKINSPALTIRRMPDKKLFVAGIDMSGQSHPEFANWLLEQRNIDISNASIVWRDDFLNAPPLALNQLNLHIKNPAIQNLISQHTFTISALPSVGSSEPILVTGHFYGNDISRINLWHGQITLAVKNTDLSVWKQWLNMPVDIKNGLGRASLTLDFANNSIKKIVSEVALNHLTILLKDATEPLAFQTVSGQFGFSATKDSEEFTGKHVNITMENGLDINNAEISILIKSQKSLKNYDVKFAVDALQLEAINQLSHQLTPYFNELSAFTSHLNNLAPAGLLAKTKIRWAGDANHTETYQIYSQFNGISILAYNKIPGFTNLTGEIEANQSQGKITLNTKNALVDLKQILRLPVPIDSLNGVIDWDVKGNNTVFSTKHLHIANPHIVGNVNANYDMNGVKGGVIDLNAEFDKGNAKYAYYYYPISLGKDTLHWLDTSILSGHADDVHLTVKGHAAEFPFVNKNHQPDASLGIFKVTAKLSDIQLDYGTGWPHIEGLGLDMLFEGTRMQLKASKGHLLNNKIINATAEIPVLDADSPMLNIVGDVQGLVTDAINFVNKSPVKKVTLGFTDELKTTGNGKLNIELKIPMLDSDNAKFKGSYQVTNGTIAADKTLGLPELSRIFGKLNFTENNLQASNILTWVYGGPAQFSLNTAKDKVIHINARGRVTDFGLKQALGVNFAEKLSGSTDWASEITVKKPLVDISLRSTLLGMAVNLPAPFYKSANEQSILRLDKKALNVTTDQINIGYANLLNAKLLINQQNNISSLDRGEISLNASAELPAQKGLSIRGSLDYLDADEWREAFKNISSSNNKLANSSNNKSTSLVINKAELNIKALDIFDRRLNNLVVNMKPTADGWKGDIQSKEINGNMQWISKDNGKIIAHLKDFSVPELAPAQSTNNTLVAVSDPSQKLIKKDFRKLAQRYPALDIVVDNIVLPQKNNTTKDIGKLELVAYENNEDWVIQKLKISNEDSTLTADGNWHNWTHNPNTRLNFVWDVLHVNRTLKRFGQPDIIQGGTANIAGQLSWQGSPHEFETNDLNGNFRLKANKGQIIQVQPGVGRLLGLLSLQSLPRRLTLDFRDLFSSGFAYDKVTATAKIDNGVMRSDDFYMTGPAAEVKIKGETNLQKETQNLDIKVIPHVSDSLSLAAFAGGPIAGVAAFVAQKLLKDPLNKVSAAQYKIVGTWDNPQELTDGKLTDLKTTEKAAPAKEVAPNPIESPLK